MGASWFRATFWGVDYKKLFQFLGNHALIGMPNGGCHCLKSRQSSRVFQLHWNHWTNAWIVSNKWWIVLHLFTWEEAWVTSLHFHHPETNIEFRFNGFFQNLDAKDGRTLQIPRFFPSRKKEHWKFSEGFREILVFSLSPSLKLTEQTPENRPSFSGTVLLLILVPENSKVPLQRGRKSPKGSWTVAVEPPGTPWFWVPKVQLFPKSNEWCVGSTPAGCQDHTTY